MLSLFDSLHNTPLVTASLPSQSSVFHHVVRKEVAVDKPPAATVVECQIELFVSKPGPVEPSSEPIYPLQAASHFFFSAACAYTSCSSHPSHASRAKIKVRAEESWRITRSDCGMP
uniref:Uncharacterized protein n=1 Tax=Cucumis melo TaxID=3656 RepID=A0A9I9EBI2_CUCME